MGAGLDVFFDGRIVGWLTRPYLPLVVCDGTLMFGCDDIDCLALLLCYDDITYAK
ncbi:hypothetical protein RIVM261_056910 [Rivularia sp. IAM M-261]|nr:hypothetical protein RIVM261_056910 [Rivularia sp. IAM M-261]